ncbi:MAG: carboxypeptidase-like regulatory domain-containing protein, partial [Ignavibacteriaceae bacterium]
MLKTILNKSRSYLFMKLIITLMILLMQVPMLAQSTGSITGKIVDKNTNEELIGANVLIEGTTIGASTDIDGNFIIKGLDEGSYTVKVSYISYQTITIKDVQVQSKSNTKIDVSLESTSTELQEVLVTAEALKNTETSVLKIQKNSANIVDGFSGELIKKNGSSDGTDVLKRMTGVTISEGKYAFVRGVGDRYNNTLLNGASLPSTDPEKKSFSYDIFPANLIESVITAKTFTPDKPADFTGGLVQISTVEFPNKFTSEVSFSTGMNTLTSFKNYLTYSGGKTDYLGVDDGTRNYPGTIGSTKVVKGNYPDAELQD